LGRRSTGAQVALGAQYRNRGESTPDAPFRARRTARRGAHPRRGHLDWQTRNVGFSSLRTHQELFCSPPQSCSVFSTTLTPDSGSASALNFAPF